MVPIDLTLSSRVEVGVLQLSECGVQGSEHQELADLLDKVNWHDLNMLRYVAEAPSLRKASRLVGVSVNTLRSRLDRLEKTLGTTLFARSRDGLRITSEGRAVLRVAHDMWHLGNSLPLSKGNHILTSEGEVRVCASEGVGTFWLTPRLPALKLALPDHVVTLNCSSDQERVTLQGYDVAVGFQKPDDLEAVCAKLATVHVMLFASEDYIRLHGVPQSLDDLDGHQFIEQVSPGMRSDSIGLFLTHDMVRKLVAIRVSSSFSLYWAVVNGVGIGAMPTYAGVITRRVKPIDLPVRLRFELWLSYRREARHSEPVRKVVQWLRESFAAHRYPWFADHFIHPDDLTMMEEDTLIVPMFDHLTGDK